MGYKNKSGFNKLLVIVILIIIICLYLYQQWCSSVVLRESDRINVAVFTDVPFVFSLNRHKNLAVITYFRPDYLVKVPQGYDWYKVGSLDLLGKIEKQRETILKQAFTELMGVPIDFIYYPRSAEIIEFSDISFNQFYYDLIKKQLFSSQYKHSVNNLFDRLLIKGLFQVRHDHLVFLETTELGIREKERIYYYSDKLDTKLKGLFYHDSLLNEALKAVVVTNRKNYNQANLILRQLEGIGVKVIEIKINDRLKNKQCLVEGTKKQKPILNKLKRLFNCHLKIQKSAIIKYTL